MPLPDPEFDDTFLFTPSFMADDQLMEGKAIGTAKVADLTLLQNMLYASDADPANYAAKVKVGATVGKRKLSEVQERVKTELLGVIIAFQRGKIDEATLEARATKTMKTAWRDVFLAGVRSAGFPGEGAGKGKTLVKLTPKDEAWFKSAVQHEMRFLNKFLTAITENAYSMPLDRRAQMYVDALRSFYESARVIALPSNCVLHWVGPHDATKCAGCTYLLENGPYTKFTLPTVPTAGMTPCLSNCRDRVLVRRVTLVEVQQVEAASPYTRGGHVKNLRAIKRTGKAAG